MAGVSEVPEGSYRPEMDAVSHEWTYSAFRHFTSVASVFVACIVVGLAVGGLKHGWWSAILMIILAHIATAIGLFSPRLSWRPPAVVLGILFLMLALY